jgi:thiol-disulfide isomerase/thioredoxin
VSGHRRAAAALALVAALLSEGAAAQSPSPYPRPAAGDVVQPFDAVSLQGGSTRIAYDAGSVTVLLFFLSSCPTCHKMIPEWNAVYERRPKHVRIIGVLMDQEPPGFFDAMPVAFPVVRSPSRDFLRSYKVHQTPTMMRIGPGGKVQDVTVGWVDRMRVGEMFRP